MAAECAQELDALLKQKSIFLVNIASLERDAEYDKEEVKMEWPDLTLFLTNQLTEIDEQLNVTPQPSVS